MTAFPVLVQYLLPHRLLSRIVRWATRWTFAPWKNFLIRTIVKQYDVNLDEAENADLAAYANFNAFFTRALKSGARPLDADPDAVLCPADGRISQAGPIEPAPVSVTRNSILCRPTPCSPVQVPSRARARATSW